MITVRIIYDYILNQSGNVLWQPPQGYDQKHHCFQRGSATRDSMWVGASPKLDGAKGLTAPSGYLKRPPDPENPLPPHQSLSE